MTLVRLSSMASAGSFPGDRLVCGLASTPVHLGRQRPNVGPNLRVTHQNRKGFGQLWRQFGQMRSWLGQN